ncbi:hypothetical protein [Saccharopolyspora sp. 5N708]|uniref:hypothetical protein n=1 Tax=Saccharopolyspora sp. 5N708 TaxID=3457424 RepID=UPI003FD21343
MKRILGGLAMAASAMVFTSAVTAPAAHAGPPDDWSSLTAHPEGTSSGWQGGYGQFNADGDWFRVQDLDFDGYGVVLRFETDYGRLGDCINTQGSGKMQYCNFNLRETGQVHFWVCMRDAGSPVYLACGQKSPWVEIDSGTIHW